VFIPQVVLLEYESDAVTLLRDELKAADDTVLYNSISSSQWTAMKTQIKSHLVGFYNATDANIRILDDATGLSSPYTVVRLKEGSAYYGNTWGYGPCDYDGSIPNRQPDNDCAWVFVWNARYIINEKTYALGEPLPPLPLGPDNLSWSIALTACHELGHSLGLVYHNTILAGTLYDHNSGTPPSGYHWYIQPCTTKDHLDPALDWCWKQVNIDYLKFILPKE